MTTVDRARLWMLGKYESVRRWQEKVLNFSAFPDYLVVLEKVANFKEPRT